MVLIKVLGVLFYSFSIHALSSLPELKTKQSLNNLRFISKDGKFTYYQRRSGSLLLSTNYRVKEVLKGDPGTQYRIIGSPDRKYLIIEQDQSFHTSYNIRKLKKIYLLKMGDDFPKEIGIGRDAQLHLEDQWVSFFTPSNKKISFYNISNQVLNFEIILNNIMNPYFVPKRIMLSNELLYITDINEKGFPGIIEFDRSKNNSRAVFKENEFAKKIEICKSKKHLFFGSFGYNNSSLGSSIWQMPLSKVSFDNKDPIYKSDVNDIGNIICRDKKIYFSKNFSKTLLYNDFKIVELDLASKKIKKLSDFKEATHIIDMDGSLLIPHGGKYYVLEGEDNLSTIDSLKASEEK